MTAPKNYREFLNSIRHYDAGELNDMLGQKHQWEVGFQQFFQYAYGALPACYILDYTKSQYIFGTENIRNFIDRPLSHFLDGGVELAISLFHQKDLAVYSEKVIIDNIQFLKDQPRDTHHQFIFRSNYRIRTANGDYRNVLQQSIFVQSANDGVPLVTFGWLFDITAYRNDSLMVHRIDPVGHTMHSGSRLPLIYNTYYSEEQDSFLTPREIEVMKYLCDDLTSAQIGDKMGISRHTVDVHRRNLILKTNSRTVMGVVSYAFKNRYV